MIEVKLEIGRDIVRNIHGQWVDLSIIESSYCDDGVVFDCYEEYTHTSREQALLDLLAHFGYNVQIEESLTTEE